MNVTRLGSEHTGAIVQLLGAAMDANNATQRPAEAELARLSQIPGFCTLLLEIGANNQAPEHMRTLALVVAKNAVHANWSTRQTKNGPVGIVDEEKVAVRATVLDMIEQPANQVAMQVALLIGKIARHDYPSHWPSLMPRLFRGIQDQNPVLRLRSLLCLHHVILALRSRTQLAGKMQFHDAAPEIFAFLSRLFLAGLAKLFAALKEVRANPALRHQLEPLRVDAEQTKFALKCLHGLLVSGFSDWSEANGVLPFMRQLLDEWTALIAIRSSLPEHDLIAYMTQYEKLMGKIIIETFKKLPYAWPPLLVAYLQFALTQLKQFDIHRKQEKFLVDLMLFIKLVITCKQFEKGSPGAAIVAEFSKPAILTELTALLITRYMIFSRDELEEWKSYPEQFTHEEDMDIWTERKRAMAENLFGFLLENNRQEIGPFVCRILQESVDRPSNLQEMLLKDAVYNAIAISPYDLYKFLPFDQWWKTKLLPQLQINETFYNILHRRIMLIVAAWASSVTHEIQPSVYEAVVATMAHADRAVALSAAYALALLVKDMEFKADVFEPRLEATVRCVSQLIATSVTSDTILKLLDLMSHLVTEMTQKMRPFLLSTIQLCATLWEKSRDQHFIKGAVAKLLNDLVKALGTEFDAQAVLQPVLEHALNVNAPDSVYLLEDGISLWLTTLRSLSKMTDNMMRLFPNLFRIVQQSYEHFDVCMSLLETYILLGGSNFLSVYFSPIVEMLSKVIDDVREEGTIVATKPVEVLLLLFPQEATVPLDGLFQKLLTLIVSNQESTRAYCAYCGVFCRLLLHNQAYFLGFFERMSNSVNSNLLASFLPFCLDKIEHVAELGRRKVIAMALLTIITQPATLSLPDVTQYLANLIIATSSIIIDEEAGPGPEWVARPEAEITDDYELYLNDAHAVPVNVREWRLLYRRDPINSIELRKFCEARLKDLSTAQPALFAYVIKEIPDEVMRGLGAHN